MSELRTYDNAQLLHHWPQLPHLDDEVVCFVGNFDNRRYPYNERYFNRELMLVLLTAGHSEIRLNGRPVSLSAGTVLLHGPDYLTDHRSLSSDLEYMALSLSESLWAEEPALSRIVAQLLLTIRRDDDCTLRLSPYAAEHLRSELEALMSLLDDPRMILVSRTHRITEDYPVETKECGSATAINKTLQTEAADAFLSMQAAAAKDGVDVRMQSGYRSVSYQKKLYDDKTQYYRNKGLSEAAAREKAAAIVNPPGCSEHNCGLAADLNSPEHTTLDTGFADTAAFRWLCENAEQYGFILRYPKEAESVTGITYEPWHWRYVGPENAALLNQSGLCLEDAITVLQRIAAGETVTG